MSDFEPPHPADSANVVEFEQGKATAKKRKKKPPAVADELPPLTADDVTSIIEEEIFDENGRFRWTLDPVKGVYSTPRSQQDGKLTIAGATKDLSFGRIGLFPKLDGDQIAGALRRIISDKRAELWLTMQMRHGQKAPDSVLNIGPDNYYITEFLKVLADRSVLENDELLELKIAEMRHWIWNTKRRLMGLPDSNHIFLDWHGVGGSGKSTLALKMIKTIYGELAGPITLNAYDPLGFNKDVLWQLLVGFADEANGEDSISVSNLKNGISSPVALGRNMYSEQSPNSDRNMSLIICRNGLGIWHKLGDDRRTASLLCDPTHGSENANRLDYALSIVPDMFGSVYYDEPEPLRPYVIQRRAQMELSTANESFVALWLANCCTELTLNTGPGIPYAKVKHSMRKYRGNNKDVIPATKADMKAALELAGAVMTSTTNVYHLTSHSIHPDWL